MIPPQTVIPLEDFSGSTVKNYKDNIKNILVRLTPGNPESMLTNGLFILKI
ncbi:hypothetical protein SAMN05192550_2410 [Flavobacterium glycines]|jgi:hypothetical protein|uniref:Uncharacterized protein n=1 Tax=Flavobacterium glycines TaxID=551990 RepID=A0A1G8UY03_9FLAO|nr:hypothetical protein [Flavobacterium glycines]SDJ58742.1 hypothetical protein SAMN05192550_2410 [Flavobacterium glycines]